MKKKKIQRISLGFLLLLIFSLSACSKKRTAREVLSSSIAKSSKTSDCDMEGNMKYKVTSKDSSENMNFIMAFQSKISNASKKSMKMEMDSKISVFNQLIQMNAHYTDGYYYLNTDNKQKQKIKMNLKQLKEQLKNTTGQTQLSINNYTNLKLSQKDGRQILSYDLTKKGREEYIGIFMSQLGSLTGNTSNQNPSNIVKITSFSGTKILNENDLPVRETLKLVMESKNGQPGKISISMDTVYKNSGKRVKVTLPSDLSSYQEVSASQNK